MGEVKIDLDAMQAFVSALDLAQSYGPQDAQTLWQELNYVWLSTQGLSDWLDAGPAWARLREFLADCR